ncbi:MAG: hypothetical protein FJ297_15760 [Planctomycetes bacterium]|nr:hypothetical protein [Planctomycetota bacterium]
MDPLISIQPSEPAAVYRPGDRFECEYQIDAVEATEVQAVEASLLWYTEGKGEDDMGVHFFQRRTSYDAEDHDLRALHRFKTDMPRSPLSYDGLLFRIRWCVRVRVFLRRGRSLVAEQPIQLGPRLTHLNPEPAATAESTGA